MKPLGASETKAAGVLVCPVCSRGDGFALVEKAGEFSIHSCPECEVQFAHPMAYSTEFYDDFYSTSGWNLTRVRRLNHREMVANWRRGTGPPPRRALRWLRSNLLPGSPVLELGFGNGWFLAALEEHGFLPMGIEVAAEPVRLLKQKGFSVCCGTLDDIPLEWPQPAAVVLFECVEHVPDPAGFLRGIHERFPKVPLLLSTPSSRRWCLRLGYREKHDYPPYHLTRWTEKAITRVLEGAGYQKVEVLFPKIDPAEFHFALLGHLLPRLGLSAEGSCKKAPGAGQGLPAGPGTLLGKTIGRFPGLALGVHDATVALFRFFLAPLATYFSLRGWSSGSMLAIASLAGHTDGERRFQ